MSSSSEQVDLVVKTMAQTAVDNETYFGDLDAVVGDGDFGFSLARGFEIVLADFDSFDRTDVGTFLKKIGVTITGRIGGTSGPIWGTAFMRAGASAAGKTELTNDDVIEMLRAAIEGSRLAASPTSGTRRCSIHCNQPWIRWKRSCRAARRGVRRSRRRPRPRGRRPRPPRR